MYPSDIAADDARTYLVVGVDNQLLLQDLVDVFQQPQLLYEESNKSVSITGMQYLASFHASSTYRLTFWDKMHIAF